MKDDKDTASPEQAERSIQAKLQVFFLVPNRPSTFLCDRYDITHLRLASIILDISKWQCRAQAALLSMSPASVMGHALAILPTNSNGMSVTDNESSRQIPPNLPSPSLLLRGIHLPSCRILRSFLLHERGPASSPLSFPTSVPSRKRLPRAIVAHVIPSSSFSHTLACRTSQSNIFLTEVMGASCVVIYQPPEVLPAACESSVLSFTSIFPA